MLEVRKEWFFLDMVLELIVMFFETRMLDVRREFAFCLEVRVLEVRKEGMGAKFLYLRRNLVFSTRIVTSYTYKLHFCL